MSKSGSVLKKNNENKFWLGFFIIACLLMPQTILATEQETDKESILCSCVSYLRSISKYQPPKVYAAKDIPIIRFEPKEGGWLLWKPGKLYSELGHASYIEKVWNHPTDSKIKILEISESNFKPCKITKRFITTKDENIRGYFYHDLY